MFCTLQIWKLSPLPFFSLFRCYLSPPCLLPPFFFYCCLLNPQVVMTCQAVCQAPGPQIHQGVD